MSNFAVVLRNRPPARVENLLRALHNGHSRVFDLMRLRLLFLLFQIDHLTASV